jgi:hypothetical protein
MRSLLLCLSLPQLFYSHIEVVDAKKEKARDLEKMIERIAYRGKKNGNGLPYKSKKEE